MTLGDLFCYFAMLLGILMSIATVGYWIYGILVRNEAAIWSLMAIIV